MHIKLGEERAKIKVSVNKKTFFIKTKSIREKDFLYKESRSWVSA